MERHRDKERQRHLGGQQGHRRGRGARWRRMGKRWYRRGGGGGGDLAQGRGANACQTSATDGAGGRQEKSVDFKVQRTAVLPRARPVSDPAVELRYKDTGPARGPPLPQLQVGPCRLSLSPGPSRTSQMILWRPRRPPHYLGQRWALSMRRAPQVVLRYACLLAC